MTHITDATNWDGNRLQDEFDRIGYDTDTGLDVTVFGVPVNIVALDCGLHRLWWSVAVLREVDVDDAEQIDGPWECMRVAQRLARPYADPALVDAWLLKQAQVSGLQPALAL